MDGKITTTQVHDDLQTCLVQQLREENDKLKKDCTIMKSQLDLVQQENLAIQQEQTKSESVIQELQEQVGQIQRAFAQSLQDNDERHATLLGQFNDLRESMLQLNNGTQEAEELLNRINDATSTAIIPMESTPTIEPPTNNNNAITVPKTELPLVTSSTNSRSIPAPSKILVDDHKKKDNRLVELRRITKQHMQVDDEEAGLRLYKLQKTMVHVVSDLKKYMKERQEDVTKSWKSIDIGTQRVAFEMVENEAQQLGVPLHLCIGYWGARRLISKSWANALRTTKKNDGRGSRAIGTGINSQAAATNTTVVVESMNADEEATEKAAAGPETKITTAAEVVGESQAQHTQSVIVVDIAEAAAATILEENPNNSITEFTEIVEEQKEDEEDGSFDDEHHDTNNEDNTRQHKKLKLA